MKNSIFILAALLTLISCGTREMEPVNKAPNTKIIVDLPENWDAPPSNYYYQPNGGLIILNDTLLQHESCVDIMLIDCDKFREQRIYCIAPNHTFDSLKLLKRIFQYWSWDDNHPNVSIWLWSDDPTKRTHLGFIYSK